MSFRLIAKNPIATSTLNLANMNVTTSGWVQLIASLPKACNAIEINNPTTSTFQISTGASTKESGSIIPYTMAPGASTIVAEIPKGTRISVQAVDATMNSGQLTLNYFG